MRQQTSAHFTVSVTWLVTALLVMGTTAAITVQQMKHRQLQEKTLAGLSRAQDGLRKLKTATTNRRQILAALHAADTGNSSLSPDMLIYGKMDALLAELKPDDITVSAIEKKDGEAALSYTMTFKNKEYNSFLAGISDLHTSLFPMTPVTAITLAQNSDSTSRGVQFTVTGKIATPSKDKP